MYKILSKEISTRMFMSIAIFALAFAITGVSVVEARQNGSDPVTASAQMNDNVTARVKVSTSTPASLVLWDLSDTTNFKHTNASSLEVSMIKVTWEADAPATTTIKIGVIASTSASGALADVYWFDEVSFSTYALTAFNGRQEKVLDYQPSVLKLNLSGGTPLSILTNDVSTSTSQFATTTKLVSPVSFWQSTGSNPGVGDLVARIYDQKGTATSSIQVTARSK